MKVKKLFLIFLSSVLFIGASSAELNEASWRNLPHLSEEKINIAKFALNLSKEGSEDFWGESIDLRMYNSKIENMAKKLRKKIRKNDPPKVVLRKIAKYLFEEEGFKVDRTPAADAKPKNVFLHKVLERKQGVCMSLSILYMSLAQELNIPLYGVSVPLHFFVRYDDGEIKINVETLKKGVLHLTDERYKEIYFVRDDEEFYMENLNRKQVLGSLLSNTAAIYTREGKVEKAIELLKISKEINPKDVEAYTNLGIAYNALGRLDDAILEWEQSVKLNKYDDKAFYNLAKAYFFKEKYQLAIKHYDQALLLGHKVDEYFLLELEPFREDSYSSPEKRKDAQILMEEKS